MFTDTLPITFALPRARQSAFATAFQELRYLWREMSMERSETGALLTFFQSWMRGGRAVVAAYRCKRFWHLLLGRASAISWLWMWPVYGWCRLLGGRHEIRPEAQIGCGFRVVHCSLACVVNEHTVAGKNLYLTGGNVIGTRRLKLKPGDIRLGDNVMLGICSLVIGPLEIGDGARIGAGAIVTKNVPPGATIVSAPVRDLTAEARLS